MSHLGARVTALVDGELPPDAAARAHAHLVECDECSHAVEAERSARRLLQTAGDPAVPTRLTAALLTMGGPAGPLPPRQGHVPGMPRPEPLALPPHPGLASELPGGGLLGGGRLRSRRTSGSPSSRPDAAGTDVPGQSAPFPHGPGRRARRRLAAAVLGSFSLASVGVISATVLTGLLADVPDAPPTTRLTVDGSGAPAEGPTAQASPSSAEAATSRPGLTVSRGAPLGVGAVTGPLAISPPLFSTSPAFRTSAVGAGASRPAPWAQATHATVAASSTSP